MSGGWVSRGVVAFAVVVGLVVGPVSPSSAGNDDSITAPATTGDVGRSSSLSLDARGNPVVAYRDATNNVLKLLHCNDPLCAGSGESITTPDSAGDVGWWSSLALDAAGNPVVSYYDLTNDDLRVLRCDDPDCSGSGESVSAPHTAGDVGLYTSLALDAAGRPVVSYYDITYGNLRILHCNDPACARGGDAYSTPDSAGDVGLYTSLVLDAAGNPVVSYYDATNGDLKLMHCNDPNCVGSDESITTPDSAGDVGLYTSVALDAAGNPVVAYHDATSLDLKLLHCNDPDCAGSDDSITTPDTSGNVGQYASLALDAAGNPVVAYHDAVNVDLKLLRCNDPNCAGADETIAAPDTAGNVGAYSSLALNGLGNPVVSYYRETSGDLRLLRCNDSVCASDLTPPQTTITAGPASVVTVSTVTVRFSSEANATFTCRLTGTVSTGWEPCTSPRQLTLGGGTYQFQVRATDRYGNTDPTPAVRSFTIQDVFVDDEASVFEADIERLAASGITRGCNPPANTRFCPDAPVTREQLAAFLTRALDLPAAPERFGDVSSSNVFAGDIGALAASRITRGCNPPANTRFCPRDVVTRQQLAAFLNRALDLPPARERFEDVSSSNVFASDIGALAASGITRGCNPPANTRFCPGAQLTRGQLAAFFVRSGLAD